MSAVEDLFEASRAIWRLALIATDVPYHAKTRERMMTPRAGDMVMEVTSFRGFDPDRIGRLLRVEGDRWVIEPYDRPGEEQGWQNADFVALPIRKQEDWP